MCYSTSRSAPLERLLANAPTLYCAVPYVVACVDVSGTVLSGPFTYVSIMIKVLFEKPIYIS